MENSFPQPVSDHESAFYSDFLERNIYFNLNPQEMSPDELHEHLGRHFEEQKQAYYNEYENFHVHDQQQREYLLDDQDKLILEIEVDQLMKLRPEYREFQLQLRSWIDNATLRVDQKQFEKGVKLTAELARGIVQTWKLSLYQLHLKSWLSKVCSSKQSFFWSCSQVSIVNQELSKMAQQSGHLISSGALNQAGAQVGKQLSNVSGGIAATASMTLQANLQQSKQVFQNTFKNEIGIGITVCCILKDLVQLSYQRFYNGTITNQEYSDRVKASVVSNSSGHLGSSIGAAIGTFVGNLFSPGVGGKLGMVIGSLICGTTSYFVADRLMDPNSQSLESYERLSVSEQEKVKSYEMACTTLRVSPHSSREEIRKRFLSEMLQFHPDKHDFLTQTNESPQDAHYKEFKIRTFIELKSSYDFIVNFRQEKNTWTNERLANY